MYSIPTPIISLSDTILDCATQLEFIENDESILSSDLLISWMTGWATLDEFLGRLNIAPPGTQT